MLEQLYTAYARVCTKQKQCSENDTLKIIIASGDTQHITHNKTWHFEQHIIQGNTT